MSEALRIKNINTPKKLGVALKRLRKSLGMSQSDLAKAMNMRQPTISDVENGRGTLESLFKIIQVLKVDMTLSTGGAVKSSKGKSKTKEVIGLLYSDDGK